jgi:hypothetical protein
MTPLGEKMKDNLTWDPRPVNPHPLRGRMAVKTVIPCPVIASPVFQGVAITPLENRDCFPLSCFRKKARGRNVTPYKKSYSEWSGGL